MNSSVTAWVSSRNASPSWTRNPAGTASSMAPSAPSEPSVRTRILEYWPDPAPRTSRPSADEKKMVPPPSTEADSPKDANPTTRAAAGPLGVASSTSSPTPTPAFSAVSVSSTTSPAADGALPCSRLNGLSPSSSNQILPRLCERTASPPSSSNCVLSASSPSAAFTWGRARISSSSAASTPPVPPRSDISPAVTATSTESYWSATLPAVAFEMAWVSTSPVDTKAVPAMTATAVATRRVRFARRFLTVSRHMGQVTRTACPCAPARTRGWVGGSRPRSGRRRGTAPGRRGWRRPGRG